MAAQPKLYDCPGCSKKGFRSRKAVTDHFIALEHRSHCAECNREFETARNFIKHHEKHLKSCVAPNPPPQPSLQRPTSISNPGKTLKVSYHPSSRVKISSHQGINMQSKNFPATSDKVVQQALRPNFTPITLDASEQALVLRYMRARCHSINRLHTQGITIHPDVAALIPSPTKASPKGSDQDAQSQISIIISRKKRGSKDQRATHKGDIAIDDFKDTPTPLVIQGLRKYKSVAIDCEMVTVVSGSNEVAFLSAVDCLTGAILINNYVLPSSKVLSWNTPSSGITPSLMNRAVRSGEAILGGWAGARQCLWDLIDADTVLVGHSISNDLNVLGMFHSKIVDSSILSAEAVFVPSESNQKLTRTWSLKTLAKELLGYEIQNRRTGHSALEDAYAARDVVIWCIQNPEEFKAWAEETHQKEMKKEEERKLAAEKAREKREKERLQQLQKSADESASGSTTPPWTSIGFDGTKEFDLVGSEATWVKVEKEKLAVFHGAGIGK